MLSIHRHQPLILLVDDDEAVQLLVTVALHDSGLEVLTNADGSRTVELAVQRQPDLILLDVDVSGLDGRDLLRALKRDHRTRNIPVFTMDNKEPFWGRRLLLELGADECLDKPLFFAGLARRINWHLDKLVRLPVTRPVLIVEDDADVRETLMELLEDNGIPSLAATNGQEALDILQVERVNPALILLDLMMPVMDGWEFRRRVEDDRSITHPPVVVMSARSRDDSIHPAAWLQKPLDPEKLLSTLTRVAHL